MGWEVDEEKENAKHCLISDLKSNITNVARNSDGIRDLIASIDYVIGGLPSGTDTKLRGSCQRAMSNLSEASQFLHQALENAGMLCTMEWVDD